MAGTSDLVFLRAFRWFQSAVTFLRDAVVAETPALLDPLADPLADVLRTRLGLSLDRTAATIDPSSFAVTRAAAESLALATMITGETLAALRTLGSVLTALEAGAADLDDLGKIIKQIQRLTDAQPGKPPSAYSIAKLLLIVSGDADQADDKPPARRLICILQGKDPAGNDPTDAQVAEPQALLALAIMAVGTVLDRAFDSTTPAVDVPRAPIDLPAGNKSKTFTLLGKGNKKLDLTFGYTGPAGAAPPRLFTQIKSDLDVTQGVGDEFALGITSSNQVTMALDVPPLDPDALPDSVPRPQFSGDVQFGLEFGRKSTETPLILGPEDGTHFSIGELTGAIVLKNTEPRLDFDLKDSKLVLKIGDDPFLGAVIGDKIEVGLTFGLVADTAGGLRLKDGTGLKATIPLEAIPNSPVQVPFLTFELKTQDNMNAISIELSGSFQVEIGPFSGSIERLGTLLTLDNLITGNAKARWALKPPSGAGLAIDAGVIKGGGFLLLDPERGEYAGILDIKLMQIGVKAIGLLGTKNPAGWSLLLIITANLPPIQLGFGFTLTGLGGLIGVQHTIDKNALSSGLSTGSLDSFLFPDNPVANAPQLFNQLRVIFPFKAGGFIIGPMLELGWGTPSLVTGRVGVLIEPSQLVFVGQVIVQLPPLVDKDLALLRLQVDFAGGVVFDPLEIWFDGVLRDSRVLFIALTGQFAFRAVFGDKPSFLISAGGFHPRFTDLPPGLPSPFQRIGCVFSIAIVGVEFKGYFAVTSATVQGGSSLRVWADIGIASFEGGFEFDAIIYIVPKFRFEVSIHVFAGIEVFGIDFASVDLYGLLAGPGRWHIVGRAEVHTPWPLPDFTLHVDESWGEDRDTPVRKIKLIEALRPELEKPGNWSAQLAQDGDAFASFAKLPPPADANAPPPLLAHPNAVLQFVQKRLPLGKQLDKIGSDSIDGERTIAIAKLRFGDVDQAIDRVLDESFSAGQFFKRSEDDLLAKPSFDRFAAGCESGQRQYRFGAAVPEFFDFEEVNLSSRPSGSGGLLGKGGLMLGSHRQWALQMSAAGRSPLRRKQMLAPADVAKVVVNPPPLATIDTASGTMAASALPGRAATSPWHAADAAAARGGAAVVVETFELTL
jgi:hypothetical protein